MTPGDDTTSAWLLVGAAVVAALPTFDSFGLAWGTDLGMLALSVGGVAAGTALARTARTRTLPPPRILLATALFLTSALASSLISDTVWSSLFGVAGSSLGFAQIAVLAVVGGWAFARKDAVREALLWVAPRLVGIQAAVVLLQVALGRHGTGTLSNATSMSQVLLLLLPLVFVCSPEGPTRQRAGIEAWRWGIAAAAVLALGAAETRVGLTLGVIVVLVMVRREWRPSGRPSALLLSAVGIVLLAAILLGLPRLSRVVSDPGGTFLTRSEMWSAAIELAREEPLVGHGPDAYRTASAPLASARMIRREGQKSDFAMLSPDPHNLVLAALVHFGAMGLAALAWLGVEIVRNWRRRTRGSHPVFPFALGVVAYCSTGLTAPLTLQTLVLFAVVLGASLGPEEDDLGGGATLPSGARIALASLILAVSACLLAHSATRYAIGPQRDIAVEDAVRTERAARLWRYDPLLFYLASARWVQVGADDPTMQKADIVRSTIARATELEPTNPFYALDGARVAAMLGDPEDEVLEAYDTALVLFPNSHDAHSDFARYLVTIGRTADAVEHIELALSLAPLRAGTHLRAAEVYRAVGDEIRAAEHERRAREL